MVFTSLPSRQDLLRWQEPWSQLLETINHAEDLVMRRVGVIAELQTLRIAALLFTNQGRRLIHSRYVDEDGSYVTLLDLAVKLGYTDVSAQLAKSGCFCSLSNTHFYGSYFDRCDDSEDFHYSMRTQPHGAQTLTWYMYDAYGDLQRSDLRIGTAWCWQCSTEFEQETRVLHASEDGVEYVTLGFPAESLVKDYAWGLRRAQNNANLPCVHAALAVVSQGGCLAVATVPHVVKLRLLDAAILLGMPAIARTLSAAVGPPRRVRPLTFWDMVGALPQHRVMDAAVGAGADFSNFYCDVVSSPSNRLYENLSLFDLAILGGHKHSANILCRSKMASFSLTPEVLSEQTRWSYYIESFGNGLYHDHLVQVASPEERWSAAKWVVGNAYGRAGIQYGPLLLQMLGGAKSMGVVAEIVGFVAEVPGSLWKLLPMI